MNPNGKRLRDVDYPRIIFHAPERTFDRLFKESSLYDLKRTVRKKLGLPSDSSISLAQIRDGQAVDLDDDDDFEAFYTVAHSQWSVDVEIRLADTQTSQSTDEEIRPRKKHEEIHDSPSMSDNEAGVRTAGATESKKRKVVFAESSTEGVLSEEPRRKKKKSESDGAVNSTAVAPSSSHDITKKKKRKSKKDDSAANPVQEGNYDVPEQSGTVEASTSQRDPDIPVDDGQPAQPGLSDPSNVRQQSKAISSSSRRTSTVKAKLPSAPDQTLENQSHKEITPTPIAGTNAAGKRSAQSSASNTRRDSTLENSKSVSQEKDDHLAGSTPSENSQDASSDEDEVTQNTMLSSRSEHGSKSVSRE
ncbi:hypothetical protein F5887DRAFT_144362 [Amanita rubescens]|nr:hypothetical protein F5887DRAFT_144362 [Amanita rubescens]